MISAHGLSKSFTGHPAVEDLTFQIPEGTLCALLGPNGAGKTTTVRLLLGLLTPTSGNATVAGVTLPASDADGARLRVSTGILTEAPGFYDRMTGRENLIFFGRLYGLDDLTLKTRLDHWLQRLELREAQDRLFGEWSKGMKQRLALIRAVLHEPQVIFLDEPTAGLDPAGAREVRDLIGEFKREGRTILLCTHNLAEAAELADLVGILRRRLLAFGTEASLIGPTRGVEVRLDSAAEPFVAAVREIPGLVDCTTDGPLLRLKLADVERETPEVVRVLVRHGAGILSLQPLNPSLEEVYLSAVGETVR